jgi:hypothetical protein
MGLGTQVVDFIRVQFPDNPGENTEIGEISIVKKKSSIFFVGVYIDMINTMRIEGGCPSDDSMDLVSFR